jgi:hypothetical protein
LTKPFGVDAFSIRWYAQVRGHELVTRREFGSAMSPAGVVSTEG